MYLPEAIVRAAEEHQLKPDFILSFGPGFGILGPYNTHINTLKSFVALHASLVKAMRELIVLRECVRASRRLQQ